ncbi:MAG: dihydrofolate reductase [Eubacterium sp.]|nr:dihydrofolate reductase [Eubacterium sp.]MDD7208652.1 dihydrofolate reductase [Lachnospiraceae bacterium]MDY5498003.1 dihydrofolate reductase [Anaerobutyricum sp.]
MKLIAAADNNWAIGKDGELLIRIPEDMRFFSRMTTGNVVVMGRKTLDSFPGGMPLPKRTNIVLTHDPNYDGRGAVVVHSEEELKEELKKYETDSIFAAGGASIYKMLLPYCDKAYITRLDYEYEADTYMPNLDDKPEWKLVTKGEERTCFDLIFHFNVYENENPKKL